MSSSSDNEDHSVKGLVERWHADLSSEAVVWLRRICSLMSDAVLSQAFAKGEYAPIIRLICGIACGVGFISALGFVGAAFGAMLGAIVGLAFGVGFCIFTFGFSLLVGPFIGVCVASAVGMAICIFFGIRICALWLESLLLYHPRKYNDNAALLGANVGRPMLLGTRRYNMERISYRLHHQFKSCLEQHATLLLPEGQQADHLWIVFGGNGMLSLDWMPFYQCVFDKYDGDTIALLLLDYPGYGHNSGQPSPTSVLDASFDAVLRSLAKFKERKPRIHLLGHSLGAAAATQLAERLVDRGWAPGRLVLSAPFLHIPAVAVHMLETIVSSLNCQEMASALSHSKLLQLLQAILATILPHTWDNVRSVKIAATDGWQICILHGAQDTIVPVSMGRRLAACGTDIEFVESEKAGHNDLLLLTIPVHARLMGLTERVKCIS